MTCIADNLNRLIEEHYDQDLASIGGSESDEDYAGRYAPDSLTGSTTGSVGGDTTAFLNDANNPTGYAKAIEEQTGANLRSFVLGLRVEAQRDATNGTLYYIRGQR